MSHPSFRASRVAPAVLLLLLIVGTVYTVRNRRPAAKPDASPDGGAVAAEPVAPPAPEEPPPATVASPVSLPAPRRARAARRVPKAEPSSPDLRLSSHEEPTSSSRVTADAGPLSSTAVVSTGQSTRNAKVDVGVDAGGNYLLPVARFSLAASRYFTVGVQAAFAKNILGSGRATAYGGGLNGAYYFAGTPFRGFLADVGVAAYYIEGANTFRSSTATPGAVSGTVGWATTFSDHINFSAGVGGQYVHNWGKNIGGISFNGLLPLLKVGLGYEF